MGMAYILYIYDDAIRDAKYGREKYRNAVGDAVLDLCQMYAQNKSAPVLNHSNGVNLVTQTDGTWTGVYLWSNNCLRSLHDLTTEELIQAKNIIQEKIDERGETSA